jgi:hypothetical protein
VDSETLRPSSRERLLGTLAVFTALALLTLLTTANGTWFDDEIASIRLIEEARSLRDVIALANGGDVHPPLGYAVDYALVHLLGQFKAVQVVAGLANSAALAGFVWLAGRALPPRAWRLLVLLAATCATAIMWGASLRWYAWFNPVFALALGAVLWGKWRPLPCALVLAAAAVILFHTSYLAVIAAPVLGMLWVSRYRTMVKPREWLWLGGIILGTALLCLPQAIVFLSVHLPSQSHQRGGLAMAFVQSAITLILGNAVFPLGLIPLAAVLAQCLALLMFALTASPQQRARWLGLATAVAAGLLLLALSGLGYKPRNAVFLLLAMLPLLAVSLAALPARGRVLALAVIAAAQLSGYANVARHQDTGKRSFNTPYALMLARLPALTAGCRHTVIAHDDEVLAYILPATALQSRPFAQETILLAPGDCVAMEQGSALDRAPADMRPWQSALDSPALKPLRAEVFHPEPAVALAGRWIGRTVEPYAARLEVRRASAPVAVPGSEP